MLTLSFANQTTEYTITEGVFGFGFACDMPGNKATADLRLPTVSHTTPAMGEVRLPNVTIWGNAPILLPYGAYAVNAADVAGFVDDGSDSVRSWPHRRKRCP